MASFTASFSESAFDDASRTKRKRGRSRFGHNQAPSPHS
eukprot:gene40474-58576_t